MPRLDHGACSLPAKPTTRQPLRRDMRCGSLRYTLRFWPARRKTSETIAVPGQIDPHLVSPGLMVRSRALWPLHILQPRARRLEPWAAPFFETGATQCLNLPNSMCAGALLRMRRINRSASVVDSYSVGTALVPRFRSS
jgi:hypothetical protein